MAYLPVRFKMEPVHWEGTQEHVHSWCISGSGVVWCGVAGGTQGVHGYPSASHSAHAILVLMSTA